ncbi:MAG: HD-GYP domain-containing protein [Desulfobacterales bacterium]|nr:HD-GYP domain-containing protein [Desulfobacterales bacterium]
MGDISNYMYDTSFIEEVLTYLKDSHNIDAVVLDSEGQLFPITGEIEPPLHKASKYYKFKFKEDIGGITCYANNNDILDKADSHICMCVSGINGILQRELEFSQTSEEMLQLSEQLNFLFKMANKVIGITKLKEFSKIVLQEISQAIGADYAVIKTHSRLNESIEITYNISSEELNLIREKVFKQIPKDHPIIFSLEDATSVLGAPIKKKEFQDSFMAFFKKSDKRFFTAYEKKFVGIIDNIISPTIESLQLYDSLQDLYLNTVKALAAAIDAKDEYTHGHSFRVAKYSITIGRKMNLSSVSLRDLEIAAYMHDLGKIGISEAILGKPGKLTDEEFTEIKKHPVLTHKILKPIHLPAFIVDAAVQHHERLDGRGYPGGLKGEAISLFARVIAVADVFDALTSNRPYRDAMSVEKALKILCDGIDKEFDRNVVLALVSAIRDDSEEKNLSEIYPDLKYADLQHMNQFLIELSKILTKTYV